jgi:hypothetical protein
LANPDGPRRRHLALSDWFAVGSAATGREHAKSRFMSNYYCDGFGPNLEPEVEIGVKTLVWKPWEGFHAFPRCSAAGEGEGEARGAGRA